MNPINQYQNTLTHAIFAFYVEEKRILGQTPRMDVDALQYVRDVLREEVERISDGCPANFYSTPMRRR